MRIKLLCPNGHKVWVDDQHAGQKGACPKCHAVVVVPAPAPAPASQRRAISDSSVMAVLGDYVPDKTTVAPASPRPVAPMRGCPKCHARISTVYRRCPQCQTYLSATERFEMS